MPRTDTEQLVVQLEARVNQFEKNFDKARRAANDNWQKIERRTDRAADRMQQDMNRGTGGIVAGFKRMGAGMVAALGIGSAGGITAGIKSVVSSLAELRAEAQRAGLASEAFQELKFAAEQSQVGVDALTDGMKELQLRADEFIVTGAGPAAEAFQRLGFDASDLARRLEDPKALLLEIIRRVERLDKAAQIRIFDELFGGTGGEQFVRFLDEGAEGIERNIAKARELGLVLDDDVLQKAEEINAVFDLWAVTISTKVKQAIIGAVAEMQKFGSGIGDILDTLRNLPENVTNIDEREVQLVGEIGAKTADLKRLLEDIERVDQPPEVLEKAHARVLELRAEIAVLKAELENLGDVDVPAPRPRPEQPPRRRPSGLPVQQDHGVAPFRAGISPPIPRERPFELPELETTDLDMSEPFRNLTDTIREAKDETMSFKEALNQAGITGEFAANEIGAGFADAIVEGRNFGDVAQSIIKHLIKIAIQALITRAIMSVFTGGAGVAVSAAIAAYQPGVASGAPFHEGGIVGRDGTPRPMPDTMPRSVPDRIPSRAMPGLASDEFPAILKRGEAVFTPEQLEALFGHAPKLHDGMPDALPKMLRPPERPRETESPVRVNVINNSDQKATVNERRNAQGGRDIDVLIGEVVAKDIRRGGAVSSALSDTFSLNPRALPR